MRFATHIDAIFGDKDLEDFGHGYKDGIPRETRRTWIWLQPEHPHRHLLGPRYWAAFYCQRLDPDPGPPVRGYMLDESYPWYKRDGPPPATYIVGWDHAYSRKP
jgi:hypothetical protein